MVGAGILGCPTEFGNPEDFVRHDTKWHRYGVFVSAPHIINFGTAVIVPFQLQSALESSCNGTSHSAAQPHVEVILLSVNGVWPMLPLLVSNRSCH